MKINLHGGERILRILIGAGVVSLAFFSPGELWYFVGLLPLITGAAGMCPVYKIFNFSTNKAIVHK